MIDIGLTGLAQSGKDSVAQVLVEEFGYTRVAFADGVREMALAIDPIIEYTDGTGFGVVYHRLSNLIEWFGWEEAKRQDDVRRLLQRVGTDAVRNILGFDTWVTLGMKKAAEVDGPVVFTDVRFPNEADAIRCGEHLPSVIVRVVRPGVVPVAAHVSEEAMTTYRSGRTILNDGTLDDLRLTVRNLMKELS